MTTSLGKESIIYGIGQVLNKSIGIFILPIITRVFTAQEIGIIELFTVIINIGFIFSTLGLDSALTFYFWDVKENQEYQKSFVSTTFYSILVFAIIITGVLAVSGGVIEEIISSKEYLPIYYLSIITVPFMALFNVLAKIARIHKKPMIFNLITILNILLYLLIVLILIFKENFGLSAIYIGRISSFMISGIIGIMFFKSSLNRGFNFNHFKQLAKYGIPLLPILFINWIMQSADRYFLLHFHNIGVVGFYSIGLKLASIVGLLISAFTMAWGPFAMSIKNDENARNIYADILLKFSVLCFVFILVINLFSPLLVLIFTTSDYLSVAPVVAIISLGLCLQIMYIVMSVGLNIVKKTYLISIGVTIAACVNIGLNILLIPKMSYFGAAIANSMGHLTSIIMVYFIGKKYYTIPYDFRKTIPAFIYFLICISLSVYLGFNYQNSILLNIVLIIILASYIGFVISLKIFDFKSYRNIFTIINKDDNPN